MIDFIFGLVFVATFIYHMYKKYSGHLLLSGITYAIKKGTEETISTATKLPNNTLLIKYKFNDNIYEIILPLARKSLNWTKAIAIIEDEERDVTQVVSNIAGPRKDFFNINLKPGQIIRNASNITFYKHEKIVEVKNISTPNIINTPPEKDKGELFEQNVLQNNQQINNIKQQEQFILGGNNESALDDLNLSDLESNGGLDIDDINELEANTTNLAELLYKESPIQVESVD